METIITVYTPDRALVYDDVKEIYELIKKRGAQSFAAEIFGMSIILGLDKFNEFTERFKRQ